MNTDKELLEQAVWVLDKAWNYPSADLVKTIRARLAEPEEAVEAVEPVAWVCRYPDGTQKFYSTEPVGTFATKPLYLHPPRPAVRLSDVEMYSVIGMNPLRIARAIEAAVLEKNGLEVKDD